MGETTPLSTETSSRQPLPPRQTGQRGHMQPHREYRTGRRFPSDESQGVVVVRWTSTDVAGVTKSGTARRRRRGKEAVPRVALEGRTQARVRAARGGGRGRGEGRGGGGGRSDRRRRGPRSAWVGVWWCRWCGWRGRQGQEERMGQDEEGAIGILHIWIHPLNYVYSW